MGIFDKIRHSFFGIKSIDEFLDIAKRKNVVEVDVILKENEDKHGYSCEVKLAFNGYLFNHLLFTTTDHRKVKQNKINALQEARRVSKIIKKRNIVPNIKFIDTNGTVNYLDDSKIKTMIVRINS